MFKQIHLTMQSTDVEVFFIKIYFVIFRKLLHLSFPFINKFLHYLSEKDFEVFSAMSNLEVSNFDKEALSLSQIVNKTSLQTTVGIRNNDSYSKSEY
jgi:hypothetical protein